MWKHPVLQSTLKAGKYRQMWQEDRLAFLERHAVMRRSIKDYQSKYKNAKKQEDKERYRKYIENATEEIQIMQHIATNG